ncbi:hypothetical protein AGLY_015167 [Aphis glycines]|uniref:Uncharacterized protein n=1 Tax=Aphis glycines TaxID=307491 RepID=A0A6G0T1D3_APHGL|nr:hypothetical protein AGLY_015167 [Aphis glycines]
MYNGILEEDKHDKHGKHRRAISLEVKDSIRSHITFFPAIASHYCTSTTSKKFIDGTLCINFVEQCINEKKSYEYNISFYSPKKDLCMYCEEYKNKNGNEKLDEEDKKEKNEDSKLGEDVVVSVADLAKNAQSRFKQHECSINHKQSLITMKTKANLSNRIDKKLFSQLEDEISYWKNILRRVVAVIKSLSSRGLPFRGQNEVIGSVHNGNFLMAIELVAQFDPFLACNSTLQAQHFSRYGNPGSGHTSYLLSTIYEDIMKLMANKIIHTIVDQIKKCKYFSLIIDSTPDITHTDQLSFIVRYVYEGIPVERFIQFIPSCGHKADGMKKAVLDTLESLNISINDCRG